MPNSLKYLSLLPQNLRQRIGIYESLTSIMSELSESSNIRDVLEKGIQYIGSEESRLMMYRDALHEIRGSGIDEAEFQKEPETAVEDSVPLNELIWAWQRGESAMIQDMEDEIETNVSGVEVYESAFTNCVISRFLGPDKQGNSAVSKPEQEIFRRLVLDRYAVIRGNGNFKIAYCHLVHWDDPRDVRVAQLAPRQLAGMAVSLLFLANEIDLTNPRNGISLHKKVQLALDAGKVAIIPAGSDVERKWKVVLVDQSVQEEVVRVYSDRNKLDQEMDGRELKFLTRNQPARRFLFFRFVLTYIQAKIAGNTTFTCMVETCDDLWAYPGEYLDLSILTVLAKNIAGIKLPPSITKHTFNNQSPAESGAYVAAQLRQIIRESNKRWEDRNSNDDSESDEGTGDWVIV